LGYLIAEMALWLGLAAAVGLAIGWWLRTLGVDDRIAEIEGSWAITNQALTRERDQLRVAIDQHALRYSALERKNDDRGVRLREMEAERDSAQSIATTAKTTLDGLRKRLEQAEADRLEHEREVELLQSELAKRAMAVETLQTELSVAQDSRAQRDVELQSAHNQRARLDSEARKQRNRFDQIELERDRLRSERESLGQALIAAQGEIDNAKEAMSHLREQAIELRHRIDEATEMSRTSHDATSSDRAKARHTELERLIAIERNQSAILREELREQSQQIALLEAGQAVDADRADRVEELEEQIDDLDRDTERLRTELSRIREERDAAIAARGELETELSRLASAESSQRPEVTAPGGESVAQPVWVLSAPQGEIDDLKKIRGIGPVLENSMNSLGIFHYRQIADWAPDDVDWATRHINAFPGRIERDEWIEQADRLHRLKYGDRS